MKINAVIMLLFGIILVFYLVANTFYDAGNTFNTVGDNNSHGDNVTGTTFLQTVLPLVLGLGIIIAVYRVATKNNIG